MKINVEELIRKLDENFVNEELSGINYYYYKDKKGRLTKRIVALRCDDAVALCINSYGIKGFNEEKMPFVIFNKYNPLFVLIGNDNNLFYGINSLIDILQIGGDLNVINISNNNLVVGELDYNRKYKIENNPLYNRDNYRHNIKAIGDITRNRNKIKLRLERLGLSFDEVISGICATNDPDELKEYIYENINDENKEFKVKKKTL